MQHLHNILFVSDGKDDETNLLKQVLSSVNKKKATLTVLLQYPVFPENLEAYREQFEQFQVDRIKKNIQKALECFEGKIEEGQIKIKTEATNSPAIHIIRRVLKRKHDLVVKRTEQTKNDSGFRAVDMKLLRKCPCPVWLCQTNKKLPSNLQVGVAIDPYSLERDGRKLSQRLLELSSSLSVQYNTTLQILSCWDCEIEHFLRTRSWEKIPEKQLEQFVEEEGINQCNIVNELLKDSSIEGKSQLHFIRGRPDERIPHLIEDFKIDILVMGTVAREGVTGFFIGNTAENVLQNIDCSLIACKPSDFVSPITAD